MRKAVDLEPGDGASETEGVISFDQGRVVSDSVVVRSASLILEGRLGLLISGKVSIKSPSGRTRLNNGSLRKNPPRNSFDKVAVGVKSNPSTKVSDRWLDHYRIDSVTTSDVETIVVLVTVSVDEIERVTRICLYVKPVKLLRLTLLATLSRKPGRVSLVASVGGISHRGNLTQDAALNHRIDSINA